MRVFNECTLLHASVCAWLGLCVHVTTIIERRRALRLQQRQKCTNAFCVWRLGAMAATRVHLWALIKTASWQMQVGTLRSLRETILLFCGCLNAKVLHSCASLCAHVWVCGHRLKRSREMLLNLKCDVFGRRLLQERHGERGGGGGGGGDEQLNLSNPFVGED